MLNEKALFLGPYGENKEEFQKLVKILIDDISGWRNNYHPNDNRAILPNEMRSESFVLAKDKLLSSLNRLLAEMKQSVPIHSPRYLGHMLSDVLTPALLGYFIGLIYNQNNVVGEVSTVTTRKEMEFSKALCKMVGYKEYDKDINGSWGHLTSGGSTAILEAMWIARNMKYFPLSVKLLINAAEYKEDYSEEEKKKILLLKEIKVNLPNGERATFISLNAFTLFNLSNESIADLKDDIIQIISQFEKENNKDKKNQLFDKNDLDLKNDANLFFREKVDKYLVQNLGVAGIHIKIKNIYDEVIDLPKLYVSQTAHYSWEKNMDILGIGKSNVVKVKCDNTFKIKIDDLSEQIKKNSDTAILMVVGVVGTTEESAIDPIQKIIDYKKNLEKTENKSFFFKIDGAWGGYYLSMLERNSDSSEVKNFFRNNERYFKGIEEDLRAIHHSDSIVIDPHKMGYIPYAVGAVCYKDTRYKEFIYKSAPYLATSKENDFMERSYLGGWTVEGSRSGAAALACSLSSEVLPLDRTGYGKMILQTIKRSHELYDYFINANKKSLDIKITPVYQPQGNIVCFLVSAPKYIKKAKYLNSLNLTIFNEMSVMPNRELPNFTTTKTDLYYSKYKNVIDNLLKEAETGQEKLDKTFNLTFLRTVTMNPMLENYRVEIREGNEFKQVSLFDEFVNEIERISQKALTSILLEIIKEKRKQKDSTEKGKRLQIYWIENKKSFKSLQDLLKTDSLKNFPAIGKYLDITFENYQGDKPLERIKETVKTQEFDFSIIDLNLIDSGHKEWASGQDVIYTLYGENKTNNAGIPIVFSQFLDDKSTSTNLKNQLKGQYPNVFEKAEQFLAKNTNSTDELESEKLAIQELVKRIFILSQISNN